MRPLCHRTASVLPRGMAWPGTHLDPILGPFLEIRNDGVVPQVNEPGPEVLNADGTGQKEARACGEGMGPC